MKIMKQINFFDLTQNQQQDQLNKNRKEWDKKFNSILYILNGMSVQDVKSMTSQIISQMERGPVVMEFVDAE